MDNQKVLLFIFDQMLLNECMKASRAPQQTKRNEKIVKAVIDASVRLTISSKDLHAKGLTNITGTKMIKTVLFSIGFSITEAACRKLIMRIIMLIMFFFSERCLIMEP